MSYFNPQNPGLDGLDEITLEEEIILQNLASLSYSTGAILYIDSNGDFAVLPAGTNGQVLKLSSGIPAWQNESGGGSIDGSGTANELTYWVDSNTIGSLATATYPSLSEIAHLKGVSSAIQTQINAKANTASPTFTGTVSVPATNFTVGASLPFSDSAGTLTLQNIDALDATTEATIEAAIDTLANLNSIQGHTFTLTGAFIRSGSHSLTLTTTATSNVTLPTTGTLATLAGTETLTNKTLTTPTISSILNSGTITLPTGTRTLVARDTTDTLTNKRITKRVTTETSSATPTINTNNSDMHRITALATAITSFTTNLSGTPTDGQTLWISITDNGTARAITWGASFEASTVALPTTTVISTRLDVGFVWNTVTSKWRCIAVA